MTHTVKLIRDAYSARTSLGRWFFDGVYFAESLCDTVRTYGVKVKHETAIPGGTQCCPEKYKLRISYSNRFKRETVQIYTEEDGQTIIAQGVSFVGVRVHGLNRHKDTSGCPGVSKNRVDSETIQGTMEKEFTAKVRELLKTGAVELWVINLPQAN